MNAGLIVLLVVLVAASVFGLVRRRHDGRLREIGGSTRDGGLMDGGAAGPTVARLGSGDLGEPLGARATLVQFSSDFCQPCRAARRVLADVAQGAPGVVHVDLDVTSNLDLVRRLAVRRTPTVLVLDASGREVRRAVGVPREATVLATLAQMS